jgi:cytochrome c oxidase cbb3-type subunit 3
MRMARLASILALAIAASEGKTLYETKCAQCHGKDGVAKPPGKGSKNFSDPAFQGAWTEDAIAQITADGKGKMPGYRSKLSPEQIKAVAAHVKTLGPSK